ncbi:hypothetical protein V6N13_026140 [Hibiscus sabdariffa]
MKVAANCSFSTAKITKQNQKANPRKQETKNHVPEMELIGIDHPFIKTCMGEAMSLNIPSMSGVGYEQRLVQKQRWRNPRHLPPEKPSFLQTSAQLWSPKHAPLNLWLCDSQTLASAGCTANSACTYPQYTITYTYKEKIY